MTPEARGDLAERLIPKALDLAGLVHGDGGAQDIDAFLRRLPWTSGLAARHPRCDGERRSHDGGHAALDTRGTSTPVRCHVRGRSAAPSRLTGTTLNGVS